ncbi:HAD family hydrolase [Opitutales bacterium ASA1]|uniref:HAD family hydrolase n=1 Tax=Congregicoccus parvus TaxID=3081749 RepID=UPI002B304079|nr:HAD family hydrolase [Opitutales bacterium ASA1]
MAASSARITTIGFDADDTLWHNESIFEASHRSYCELLSRYHDAETVERTLFATEMRNLDLFGYGIKSHALSSVETAIELSGGQIRADEIRAILDSAKQMLAHPVELLEGAAEVVPALAADYRLVLITKGDLRDQERKLRKSGLEEHFAHVEILSEKDTAVYRRILSRHGVAPEQFLMVGNSLKSDILPALDLGCRAVYVPYRITWAAEHAEHPQGSEVDGRFFQIATLRELPALLASLASAPAG